MLDYSIGEFYGFLLNFGVLVFLGLIVLKGIFGIIDDFFDEEGPEFFGERKKRFKK